MSSTIDDARRWTTYGTELLDEHLARLTEGTATAPSALPGWSRKHLVAHISANADALGNLVHWAATGERTPMYSSPEQRQADIDRGANMSVRDLFGWFGRSAAELAKNMDQLTAAQWDAEVVTAQGRTVPATTIPWLRAREVMVHAVDLGVGITFADLPTAFLRALCDDIVINATLQQRPRNPVRPSGFTSSTSTPSSSSWETTSDSLSREISPPSPRSWLVGLTAASSQASTARASRTCPLGSERGCDQCRRPDLEFSRSSRQMTNAIINLGQEERRFEPPAELAANANLTAASYNEAKADRLGFWEKQADRLGPHHRNGRPGGSEGCRLSAAIRRSAGLSGFPTGFHDCNRPWRAWSHQNEPRVKARARGAITAPGIHAQSSP